MMTPDDRKKYLEKQAYERGKEDAHKHRSYKEGAMSCSHDYERTAYTRGFVDGMRGVK